MLVEIEQFVNWVRRRSAGTRTWKDYASDLQLLVRIVGDRPPGQIIIQDIDRFVDAQISLGRKPTSINRRLASVISFYAFLADENEALVCPVIPHRHHLREPQRLPRYGGSSRGANFVTIHQNHYNSLRSQFFLLTSKLKYAILPSPRGATFNRHPMKGGGDV
jgi:site-specific recombinase XerD